MYPTINLQVTCIGLLAWVSSSGEPYPYFYDLRFCCSVGLLVASDMVYDGLLGMISCGYITTNALQIVVQLHIVKYLRKCSTKTFGSKMGPVCVGRLSHLTARTNIDQKFKYEL